jgi:transposase-like protein
LDGQKEVLGLWIERNEGSKFWMGIMNELKNRGVQDCLIAAADGLAGFPDAVNTVFPDTEVQLCMVHMVRNSVKYVSYKDRKAVTAGLKDIYLAPSADAASGPLEKKKKKWGGKYPAVSKSWRSRWNEVIPFMKFSPEIRRTYGSRAVYTANAVESVNYTLQRNLKTRQSFPNGEAAVKLIFMILKRISKKWTMPVINWGGALHQFAIIYGDRVPL